MLSDLSAIVTAERDAEDKQTNSPKEFLRTGRSRYLGWDNGIRQGTEWELF